MIQVSAVLSIHNRSKLFRRALDGYVAQSMHAEQWELVLVDDMSTEDLFENLRTSDRPDQSIAHSNGPYEASDIFGDESRMVLRRPPPRWYHTPAISTNIGCAAARGESPLPLSPRDSSLGRQFRPGGRPPFSAQRLRFSGRPIWVLSATNGWLESNSWTASGGWEEFIGRMQTVQPLTSFGPSELYWYTSFLPRAAVDKVRGRGF